MGGGGGSNFKPRQSEIRSYIMAQSTSHSPFPLSDKFFLIFLLLCLDVSKTRPGLCLCQSTCKVKAAEEYAILLQAPISSESGGRYFE